MNRNKELTKKKKKLVVIEKLNVVLLKSLQVGMLNSKKMFAFYFKGKMGFLGFISSPKSMPNIFHKLIFENYAEWKVKAVYVVRSSVDKVVEAAVKAMPGVKLSGSLYHVEQYLEITTLDEKTTTYLKISKEATVLASQMNTANFPTTLPNAMKIDVPKAHLLLVKTYFTNVIAMATTKHWSLWLYDPVYANCQWFVWWCLEANGFATPELEKFVLQGQVATGISNGARISMKALTTIGNVVMRGFGLAKGKFNEKRTRTVEAKKRILGRRMMD